MFVHLGSIEVMQHDTTKKSRYQRTFQAATGESVVQELRRYSVLALEITPYCPGRLLSFAPLECLLIIAVAFLAHNRKLYMK